MTWRMTVLVAAGALALVGAAPQARAVTTPITTCGQTVSTNAVLTTDLDCIAHGIVVDTAGVTIDLKGYTISGDRGTDHYGVYVLGVSGVTIKNGVIRNFGYGIKSIGVANQLAVANVLVSGNAWFGVSVLGNGVSIKSSTANGNGTIGFLVNGNGASISSSVALGNQGDGISVFGDSATVKSSTASGNDERGIDIDGAAASVKSSSAGGNGLDGIFVSGDGALPKGNRAEGNGYLDGNADNAGRGITVQDFAIASPPTGLNTARGNDDAGECFPGNLC